MFICIARTEVDWDQLLQAGSRALGRSFTASLDAGRLPLAGVPSFLCALAEFAKPGETAFEQLRSHDASKKHASFSFLINLPRERFVTLASSGITTLLADVGDLAILTGTLSAWVQATADASNVKELRPFACLMVSWFERESLGDAWSAWDKDHLASERLFRLVKR